ncbi:MAG: aldo/keto reductase [Geminicoccaceae bacterium]
MLETRPLGRTKVAVTRIGFGGGPIGGHRGPVGDAQAEAALQAAWDAGVRYFDTAPLYGIGNSERRLGRFLPGLPRDSFVLSTKVGRLLREPGADYRPHGLPGVPELQVVYDYSYDGALRSLEESFARLKLDRADIVLIHDIDRYTHGDRQPEMAAAARDGAFRALRELREQGVVGAIGLGQNEWDTAMAFARDCDIDAVLLAGRYTLLEQGAAQSFLPFCRERGIGIILGGPYNSGILATGSASGAATYNYKPPPEPVRERVARLEAVLQRFAVELPAAALQFPLHEPAVATVIPGVGSVAEVQGTFRLLGQTVPVAAWDALRDAGLIDPAASLPTGGR